MPVLVLYYNNTRDFLWTLVFLGLETILTPKVTISIPWLWSSGPRTVAGGKIFFALMWWDTGSRTLHYYLHRNNYGRKFWLHYIIKGLPTSVRRVYLIILAKWKWPQTVVRYFSVACDANHKINNFRFAITFQSDVIDDAPIWNENLLNNLLLWINSFSIFFNLPLLLVSYGRRHQLLTYQVIRLLACHLLNKISAEKTPARNSSFQKSFTKFHSYLYYL